MWLSPEIGLAFMQKTSSEFSGLCTKSRPISGVYRGYCKILRPELQFFCPKLIMPFLYKKLRTWFYIWMKVIPRLQMTKSQILVDFNVWNVLDKFIPKRPLWKPQFMFGVIYKCFQTLLHSENRWIKFRVGTQRRRNK